MLKFACHVDSVQLKKGNSRHYDVVRKNSFLSFLDFCKSADGKKVFESGTTLCFLISRWNVVNENSVLILQTRKEFFLTSAAALNMQRAILAHIKTISLSNEYKLDKLIMFTCIFCPVSKVMRMPNSLTLHKFVTSKHTLV